MKTGIVCSILVLALTAPILRGQNNAPLITFAEKEYNFGTIKEDDGMFTHEFQFKNEGKTPLIINEVKASCGCTVPEWPREPVLPGKTGSIKVSFDPKKQSGAFSKTIQVLSNASTPQVVISIRGVVIPVATNADIYKYVIGDIRLENIYVAFGEIPKGKTKIQTLKVMNTSGDKSATLTFKTLPPYLKYTCVPEVIGPKQEGSMKIEYLTENINQWDYVVDRLDLMINGQAFPKNRISITANIREDFSQFTAEDMAKAPVVKFDNHEFDFGSISGKSTVEHSFRLINEGKSDLLIRKVTASCGCTAVQPAKTLISPGDTAMIKVKFNPAGREGNQKKAVTVITNDPRRSKSILWIMAEIQRASGNTHP